MKLSTRGRYSVTAMFDLAAHGNGEPITAADISKRQRIPLPYLEQLLSRLRKAKLVRTVRGPSGGYALAKIPSRVSIGDIIRAADGPIALADCIPSSSICPKSGCCSTRSLWENLSGKVSRVFDATSLEDLCKESHT
jgi:Rrf2 family protein